MTPDPDSTYSTIHARYTATALSKSPNTHNASTVARAFGYTDAELSSIPTDSNLGLSCGNPLALAKLKEGEVVIDLGCGAGFDIFLAAKRVGETGRVVGVDMNEVGTPTLPLSKKPVKHRQTDDFRESLPRARQ